MNRDYIEALQTWEQMYVVDEVIDSDLVVKVEDGRTYITCEDPLCQMKLPVSAREFIDALYNDEFKGNFLGGYLFSAYCMCSESLEQLGDLEEKYRFMFKGLVSEIADRYCSSLISRFGVAPCDGKHFSFWFEGKNGKRMNVYHSVVREFLINNIETPIRETSGLTGYELYAELSNFCWKLLTPDDANNFHSLDRKFFGFIDDWLEEVLTMLDTMPEQYRNEFFNNQPRH